MTCVLPLFLVILSANPCDTWSRAQDSFEEARKRVWWVSHTLDPILNVKDTFPDPKIDELEGWTIVEHPGTYFYSGDTSQRLAGLIDTEKKRIDFAAESNLEPLAHEFAHFIHYKHQEPYGLFWQYTGHGGLFGITTLDIFTFSLWTQMCSLLYYPYCDIKGGHQYSPEYLFSFTLKDVPEETWCQVH